MDVFLFKRHQWVQVSRSSHPQNIAGIIFRKRIANQEILKPEQHIPRAGMESQTFCYLQMSRQSIREISNLALLLSKVWIQGHHQEKAWLVTQKPFSGRYLEDHHPEQSMWPSLTKPQELNNVPMSPSRRWPRTATVIGSAKEIFPPLLLTTPALMTTSNINV